jgi:hypothetical protein
MLPGQWHPGTLNCSAFCAPGEIRSCLEIALLQLFKTPLTGSAAGNGFDFRCQTGASVRTSDRKSQSSLWNEAGLC